MAAKHRSTQAINVFDRASDVVPPYVLGQVEWQLERLFYGVKRQPKDHARNAVPLVMAECKAPRFMIAVKASSSSSNSSYELHLTERAYLERRARSAKAHPAFVRVYLYPDGTVREIQWELLYEK